MHKRELRRTSNTARLLSGCLPNSLIIERAEREQHEPTPLWPVGTEPAILFPADDAVSLERFFRTLSRPATLIVPDGSWGQASRIRRRVPGLAGLPCVSLPEGPPSNYRLRVIDRPSRLSTLEAVARALELFEGIEVRRALERVLTLKVERTLWLRGDLDRSDVTGGIPEHVRRHTA